MARLKRDHSGWSSHGLYLKYQQPKVDETVHSKKTKKNTRKWCRGKVGVEHKLERYFWRYGWASKRSTWIRSRCTECRKEFHSKDSSIPLRIELDESDGVAHPVQVKLNGKAIPFDRETIEYINNGYGGYWCGQCHEWHR